MAIWDALGHAHLKPVVLDLEGGLDHEIQEGGSNFRYFYDKTPEGNIGSLSCSLKGVKPSTDTQYYSFFSTSLHWHKINCHGGVLWNTPSHQMFYIHYIHLYKFIMNIYTNTYMFEYGSSLWTQVDILALSEKLLNCTGIRLLYAYACYFIHNMAFSYYLINLL